MKKNQLRETVRKLIREVVEESIATPVRMDIIRFVADNSYFEFDGEDDDRTLTFSTRQNGDVGSERPGAEDIKEGKRIGREILSKFPETSVSLEEVDEWVMLTVKEKRPKETKTSYVFVKHSDPDPSSLKSSGFSESFDDIEDLRKTVERFLPEVDFTELEVDLEDLQLKPAHSFQLGDFKQGRILVSKPGDNRYGYYFTVLKKQRDI
jgi:hypothetical protein